MDRRDFDPFAAHDEPDPDAEARAFEEVAEISEDDLGPDDVPTPPTAPKPRAPRKSAKLVVPKTKRRSA